MKRFNDEKNFSMFQECSNAGIFEKEQCLYFSHLLHDANTFRRERVLKWIRYCVSFFLRNYDII